MWKPIERLMPVICGTDFTRTSGDTLATAAAFAAVFHEPLVLAHALGELPYLFDDAIQQHLAVAARRHLEREAARLGEAVRPLRVEVLPGGPHRSLLALAREEHASLLVVGWRGHGDGRQGAPGGVAERCALRAPVPVLVARGPAPFQAWAAGQRPLRITVAVDPARRSSSMVAWLERLRTAAPCDVVAAYVAGVGAPRVEAWTAEDMTAWPGHLSGAGRFTVAVRRSATTISEEVVAIAGEHAADLLVVGTPAHPASPWSVAAGAVHLARIAVATVPASAPVTVRSG